MKTVSAAEVVEAIGPNRKIVSAPGCGTPSSLLAAIGLASERVRGSSLYSGLLLGDYPFLDALARGDLTYKTWHVTAPIRKLVAKGDIEFYPVRGSQVPGLLAHLDIDVLLIRVSPPDRHGFCSLGPSVSYVLPALGLATLVVAEVDPAVPRTRGESAVHESLITIAMDSTEPMPEYPRAKVDDISRSIAKNVIGLLPEAPTIQIGIGSIPEAILETLLTERVGNLRFAGMAVDGMVDLFTAGLVQVETFIPYPPIMAAELMGTRLLMEFADDNPALGMYSTAFGITASSLSRFDRFVSINSGIEIDRTGALNAEWVGGSELSGIGGSADFVDSAMLSSGGLRILAMPSINVRDQSSKIVASMASGAPTTVPRHSIDIVITEYGVAHLGFASITERARALASIAAPQHRDAILGASPL